MTARDRFQIPTDQAPPSVDNTTASEHDQRALYFALFEDSGYQLDASLAGRSRDFLLQQLEAGRALPCDLPADPKGLHDWITHGVAETGRQYREYVKARKAGGARRLFKTKSQALHFIRAVAPTKMVDGAWLYGLLQHWQDPRLEPLLRIYLEELGDGLPEKNHVLLYEQLLATEGCGDWHALPEDHYTQGVIQLALARHGSEFLPEVIGFNLGYEQLPLHLPITAYELQEFGIDPWYFSLHVTIDNAASGHAMKAVQAVLAAMPQLGDRARFYERVLDGYRLNMLGTGSCQVIKDFDTETALLWVFKSKAEIGALMHSDRCRVAGKTVTDWLSEAGQLPALLNALERAGWVKRDQDPRNSRFWQLLEGEKAIMFGVFTPYELQLIWDWIARDWNAPAQGRNLRIASGSSASSLSPSSSSIDPTADRRTRPRSSARLETGGAAVEDMHGELRVLDEQLAATRSKAEAMQLLIPLLGPALHYRPTGLMATRIVSKMLA